MESVPSWRHVAQTGVWVTIQGVLHLLASLVLSLLVYSAIYFAVLPDAELSYPLYFGLCETGAPAIGAGSGSPVVSGGRVASILLTSSIAQVPAGSGARDAPAPALAAGYSYTASVCLELPESPSNVDAGTFLTELTLLGSDTSAAYSGNAGQPQPLFTSARPFVLRYRSAQLRYLSNLVFLLPLVFGLMEEKQTHCAPLADTFHNKRDQPVRPLAQPDRTVMLPMPVWDRSPVGPEADRFLPSWGTMRLSHAFHRRPARCSFKQSLSCRLRVKAAARLALSQLLSICTRTSQPQQFCPVALVPARPCPPRYVRSAWRSPPARCRYIQPRCGCAPPLAWPGP